MIIHEGEYLRKWLDNRELSQKEILRKLNLKSRNSLYNYYSTERFSADVVKKLYKIGFDVHGIVSKDTDAPGFGIVREPSIPYDSAKFADCAQKIENRIQVLEDQVKGLMEQLDVNTRMSALITKKDTIQIHKAGRDPLSPPQEGDVKKKGEEG